MHTGHDHDRDRDRDRDQRGQQDREVADQIHSEVTFQSADPGSREGTVKPGMTPRDKEPPSSSWAPSADNHCRLPTTRNGLKQEQAV